MALIPLLQKKKEWLRGARHLHQTSEVAVTMELARGYFHSLFYAGIWMFSGIFLSSSGGVQNKSRGYNDLGFGARLSGCKSALLAG